jgi:hypothetical protein
LANVRLDSHRLYRAARLTQRIGNKGTVIQKFFVHTEDGHSLDSLGILIEKKAEGSDALRTAHVFLQIVNHTRYCPKVFP